MPIFSGASAARISQAAPWTIGPKVMSRQWFWNRSRISSRRLASSIGSGKTSTVAPSGSMTRSGFVATVMLLPSFSAEPGVERDAHAGKDAEPGPLEAERGLIMPVEQIIDSREGCHAVSQLIVSGDVHQHVAIGRQVHRRSGAVEIQVRADIEHR